MTKNILIKNIDKKLQRQYNFIKFHASENGLKTSKLLELILSDAIENFLSDPDISKFKK